MQLVNQYSLPIFIAGGVLGGNVGMYISVTNKETVSDTFYNVFIGGAGGLACGAILPYAAPFAIATLPAYAVATLRSSGASSPQKEDKLT